MSVEVPLVTIAMPVRNGGEELRLAVQSLLEQSFRNWELLLIDDGSTDGAVASPLQVADPRIRVLSDGLNKGLAARLNEAIDMARGRYLARMDHDDIAHPERLARQVEFLDSNPSVDLLGALCLVMRGDDEITGELPSAVTHAEICRRPWLGFYLAHPTWMGRIKWFRSHHYALPAPFGCEDQELLLRAHATSRYHALPEPLLAYRVRQRRSRSILFKTRFALLKVQVDYFLRRRKFGGAGLSLFSFGARVFADLFAPAHRTTKSATARNQLANWNDLIATLRQRADRRRAS